MGRINGSTFSTADLSQPERRLFGKIKIKGVVKNIEILCENEYNATTEIRYENGFIDEVRTSKIYDLSEQIPSCFL